MVIKSRKPFKNLSIPNLSGTVYIFDMEPLISIIIPTYKRVKELKKQPVDLELIGLDPEGKLRDGYTIK